MKFLVIKVQCQTPPENISISCTVYDNPAYTFYAQNQWYEIETVHEDAEGASTIETVSITFKQGASVRVNFLYDNPTDMFSFVGGAGRWEWDLDTDACSASEALDVLTVTWVFKPRWNATDEDDVDVLLEIEDNDTLTDSDTYNNCFDVVTNLKTSFSLDHHTGTVNEQVTASGVIYYDKTGQSYYPPDNEFTSVSVYDSLNTVKGTDTTILNGVWNITFNAPSTARNETYNLYINMNDTSYTDGEEASPTDWFASEDITGPVGPTDPSQPPSTSVVHFKVTVAGSAAEDCNIKIYEKVYDMYQGTVQTDAQGKANMSLAYGEYRYDAQYQGMTENGTFLHNGAYLLIEIQFGKARLPLSPNLTKLLIGISIVAAAVYVIFKIKK